MGDTVISAVKVSRVMLRIELSDGSAREIECPDPCDLEVERSRHPLSPAWVPYGEDDLRGEFSVPLSVAIRFSAGLRSPVAMIVRDLPAAGT